MATTQTTPLPAPAPTDLAAHRPVVPECPVCEGRRMYYAFSKTGYRLVRCTDCGLTLINPQPSDAELHAIYSEDYFLDVDLADNQGHFARIKGDTARLYLNDLATYRGKQGGRLLEIGCGHGDLLLQAQSLGYHVTGVELSSAAANVARQRLGESAVLNAQLETANLAPASFDVCILSDVIEHVRQPLAFLRELHRVLAPGGVVFIATPSLDSWSAKLLRENWMEWKPEHLYYFDPNNMRNLLYRAGFHHVIVTPGWKMLSLSYVWQHFARFRVPMVSRLVSILFHLAPASLRNRTFPVVASGMAVFAEKVDLPPRKKLSIIVPAFNEAATFKPLMDALLNKDLGDIDSEIIIVESNSTDGTRQLALQYQQHPRVKLVLEDRPSGKGHAVRTGFDHATGDFILIQDADLEYDLEDYNILLEPLLRGQQSFVLGSRHGGSALKMRQFANQRLLSMGLNCGHMFFRTLLNVLFRQHLKDPFTMYKVFRRDCLFGLTFQCNRFDFDYELLIKLVGKGYRPIEIPVNYRSRSFKDGKKVSPFRDPLSWLKVMARLWFKREKPLEQIERLRRQTSPSPLPKTPSEATI